MQIGVIGAGTMGAGIAELAAANGCNVHLMDNFESAEQRFWTKLKASQEKRIQKGKLDKQEADAICKRIVFTKDLSQFTDCQMVIEAVIEDIKIKKDLFSAIEKIVSQSCILASNTSSLSVTSIGAGLQYKDRFLGIHFFNPATIMKLVEIVRGIDTEEKKLQEAKQIIGRWNKTPVVVKDTPGFIVNRVARPFYGEALRIYEEGIADIATIDNAIKKQGHFRMGPFELMDFIGNDVNFAVTETVFREFWFDPRYKPSFTQKRMVESGRLGRKTQKGYYDYADNASKPSITENNALEFEIFNRVLAMLINEAADALYLKIASRDDIDAAMQAGVNYPKGLLKWADEIGIQKVLQKMDDLHALYLEDRYRASPLLRKMAKNNTTFY